MKIEALRALIKLSENGCNFGVHEQLGMSRSNLWFLIGTLEKEIGLTLLIRKKKNNVLTEEARCFLPYARQAIGILEEGVGEASLLRFEEESTQTFLINEYT